MATRLSSDRAAAVDTENRWRPVGPGTPRGVKLLVINRAAGVATFGQWAPESWWTHWAPLPTFTPVPLPAPPDAPLDSTSPEAPHSRPSDCER